MINKAASVDEGGKPLTSQLVKANLNLKGSITVCLIHGQIFWADEGDLLIRSLGAQHVAKRHVLESLSLSDVVVVGTGSCQYIVGMSRTQKGI